LDYFVSELFGKNIVYEYDIIFSGDSPRIFLYTQWIGFYFSGQRP